MVKTTPRHSRCQWWSPHQEQPFAQDPKYPRQSLSANCITNGGRWMHGQTDGWTGVYGSRLKNPNSPGNIPKALSSLLQWLSLPKGWGWGRRHFIPALERLSFQSLFRQDWNKMSLLCSAAHGSSTATVLPAQRTPQGADMLSPPSPPRAG